MWTSHAMHNHVVLTNHHSFGHIARKCLKNHDCLFAKDMACFPTSNQMLGEYIGECMVKVPIHDTNDGT